MRNWWIVVVVIVIFALAVWGTFVLYQKQVIEPSRSPSPLAIPENGFGSQAASPSPSPDTLGTSQPGAGASFDSQPATGIDSSKSGVVINSPQENSLISSPLAISGWSKIETGNVLIILKDENGNNLGQSSIATCPNFQVCSFDTSIIFKHPSSQTGTIEIFESSTADLLHIPISSLVVQFR